MVAAMPLASSIPAMSWASTRELATAATVVRAIGRGSRGRTAMSIGPTSEPNRAPAPWRRRNTCRRRQLVADIASFSDYGQRMDSEAVEVVRRFNRTVTQRVGALQSQYLARDRSLGASRVLWEIGAHGRDVRDLRATLDLDSGYLSRLLRSLERAGLAR